jgi:hypothetical protein
VREESHLDDMRAAIRGDFERLAERRGEQVVLRVRGRPEGEEEIGNEVDATRPAPTEIDDSSLQQTVASEAAQSRLSATDESEPHHDGSQPSLQQSVAREDINDPSKRSWIDRLLGR